MRCLCMRPCVWRVCVSACQCSIQTSKLVSHSFTEIMCSCDFVCLKKQFHTHTHIIIWSCVPYIFSWVCFWLTDFIYPAAIPVLFPSTGAFSSNSYSIETSTCQLFLSVSFNFMTLTLQALGLSFIFRERSEMSVFQTVMSLPCVCVCFCRWRRWRSTITAWPSAQRGLRVKPTTSALTVSRSTCAGTDTLPRYCVCLCAWEKREREERT